MKIGIICAMRPEVEIMERNLLNSRSSIIMGLPFYEGKIGNHDVVLSLSGMGKVNSAIGATVLINIYKVDIVINSGIAGGILPLKKRDSVIATSLYYNDVDARFFGYEYGQVPGMPMEFNSDPTLISKVEEIFNKMGLSYRKIKVVSGDQFVTSMEQLKNIPDQENIATEMEGAAIAQTCYRANIPFIVLRYISDIVGVVDDQEYYQEFEDEMSNRSSQITLELLKNID